LADCNLIYILVKEAFRKQKEISTSYATPLLICCWLVFLKKILNWFLIRYLTRFLFPCFFIFFSLVCPYLTKCCATKSESREF